MLVGRPMPVSVPLKRAWEEWVCGESYGRVGEGTPGVGGEAGTGKRPGRSFRILFPLLGSEAQKSVSQKSVGSEVCVCDLAGRFKKSHCGGWDFTQGKGMNISFPGKTFNVFPSPTGYSGGHFCATVLLGIRKHRIWLPISLMAEWNSPMFH